MRRAPATAKDDTKDDEESRRQRKQQRSTGSWEEPDSSILDDRRGELPEFPCETLPPSGNHGWTARRAWCRRHRRSCRGAGDHDRCRPGWHRHAGACLAVMVGAAHAVERTDRVVRHRKDPGIDVTKRALASIERARKERVLELQRQHDTKAETAKAEQKQWKKQVEEAVAAGQPPPPMPAQRRRAWSLRGTAPLRLRQHDRAAGGAAAGQARAARC